MTDRVGTLRWAEATGGQLRGKDQAQLLLDASWLLAKTLPEMLLWRALGRRRKVLPIDVSTLRVPDTRAAMAAQQVCETLSPCFMLNHCVRTYWFSRLLGEQWNVSFDDEALYVSAMLHDIALMPGFKERRSSNHCFTVPSGRMARRVAAEAGWSSRRQDLVDEAIVLNPNSYVHASQGIEAHLLNAGVLVDAMGLRCWCFHERTIASLLEQAPRLELKKSILQLVDAEADAHPDCRFHFARRWFLFKAQVRAAPFPS